MNSTESSSAEPRRSSRIRENVSVVKRKIEDVSTKGAKKRPRKDKTKSTASDSSSYFSIFDKQGPLKCVAEEVATSEKNVSAIPEPRKTKRKSKKVRSPVESCSDKSSHSDDVVVIDNDLQEPDCEIVSQEARPFVPYHFVSSFLEPGIAISSLENHVQQFENLAHTSDFISNFKIVLYSPDVPIASSLPASTLRNINSHYGHVISERNDSKNKSQKINVIEDHSVWVEKYKPKVISDVLGHTTGLELLTSWLTEWKQKLKGSKGRQDGESSNSSYAYSDEEDDMLKCVLLTGTFGRGKTSVVYAVAQELGFKVFEVNPSSSRIGRHILSQLQEATLSHHVEGTPKLSFFGQISKPARPMQPTNDIIMEDQDIKQRKLTKIKAKSGQITNFFQKAKGENKPVTEIKTKSKKKDKNDLLSFFKPQIKKSPTEVSQNKSLEADKPNIKIHEEKDDEWMLLDQSLSNSVSCQYEPKSNNKVSQNKLITQTECEIVVGNTLVDDVSEVSAISVPLSQPDQAHSRSKLSRKSRKHVADIAPVDTCTTDTTVSINGDNRGPSPDHLTNGEACSSQLTDIANHLSDSLPVKLDDKTNLNNVPETSGLKFSSLSVILFDDADINLTEDEGFWSSINSFLKITRKPVILTAGCNIEELLNNITSDVQVLDFGTAHNARIIKHLKSICCQENFACGESDLKLLFQHCCRDLRQTITQLQFWKDGREPCTVSSRIRYNIPPALLCLRSNVRQGLLDWIFKSEYAQAVELIIQYNLTGYDILYNNMYSWLPFPIQTRNVELKAEKTVKKYKRLDVSWLDDEASVDVTMPLVMPKAATDRGKVPYVCETLACLANMYDNFSVSDILETCDVESSNSYWFENRKLCKKDLCVSLATEAASWVRLSSARLTTSALEKYPTALMPIYGDKIKAETLILNRPADVKLFRARQMLTNSVLCFQRLNHTARCLDYFAMLRGVSKCEEVRKEVNPKRSRRFLHYFNSNGFSVRLEDLACLSKAFN